MFKLFDKVEFIDKKRRSIHQGLVTGLTSHGAHVLDPRMQTEGCAEQAEWFAFKCAEGYLQTFTGSLTGPSTIQDMVRAG